MQEFGRNLEYDIVEDTSGDFGRIMTSLVSAGRDEQAEFDEQLAEKDARHLQAVGNFVSPRGAEAYIQAGIKKLGTDEKIFNEIFCSRNWQQLEGTFEAYKKTSGRDIKQDIRKEFSGDIKKALLAIGSFKSF